MSYDIGLYLADGTEVFSANMTSNVSEMWYENFECAGGLQGLSGLNFGQARPHFKTFWENIDQERHSLSRDGDVGDPVFCAKYDAENGWGSALGALIYVARLQSAWAMNPNAKLSVWV